MDEKPKTPMEMLDAMEVQLAGVDAEPHGINIPFDLVNVYRTAATRMKMSTNKRFTSKIAHGGIQMWRVQ